jgi:asparaginyl-tRNA synthetase
MAGDSHEHEKFALVVSRLISKPIFTRARVHFQAQDRLNEAGNRNEVSPDLLKKTKDRYLAFEDPRLQAIARIEAALLAGGRKYFDVNGFIEVTVPHITKATGACENVSTMFDVDFFGERRYLAQTGQLYLEVLTPYLGKVWASGPSFRAEPSVDDRHLVEFPLVEIEFRGGFDELLGHIEGTVTSMVKQVLGDRKADLETLGVDSRRLATVSPPFRRITYDDAIDLLADTGVQWGDDLRSQHEKLLAEYLGGRPLFVTHYPKNIKFFNMKENERNPDLVDSADLILPFSGEAVGAAEREYEYERLKARLLQSSMFRLLKERGGSLEDFDWYLNFYKETGGVQHSGCGIGMNRVTQFVLGAEDIRGTTTWPVNRESNF